MGPLFQNTSDIADIAFADRGGPAGCGGRGLELGFVNLAARSTPKRHPTLLRMVCCRSSFGSPRFCLQCSVPRQARMLVFRLLGFPRIEHLINDIYLGAHA